MSQPQPLQETQGVRRTALIEREQLEHFTQEIAAKDSALQLSKQEAETCLRELEEALRREASSQRRIAELERHLHEAWSVIGGGGSRDTSAPSSKVEVPDELLVKGVAWAIASRLTALRWRLAPQATQRDRWLRLVLRGIRLWQREGFRVLCSRASGKVGRRLRKWTPAFLPRLWCKHLSFSSYERWFATQYLPPADLAAQKKAFSEYERWFARQQPTPAQVAAQRQSASAFPYRPVISILTPVYNTPTDILRATIASVQAQTYDNWELCLADGKSSDPAVRCLLEKAAKADPRIRVRFLPANQGISDNSNACLELARGEFVGLLDHDDMLAPCALFEVVKRLNEDPQLDFLYSDKDLITADGSRHFNPLFKPAWSPDIMLLANYLTHFNVLRTDRVRAVGGFNPETDGAQDWDLFFRVLEGTTRIAHIPKVLYHWRYWPQSTSAGIEAKPYATTAQVRAINDHCRRTGRKGEVVLQAGHLRLRRDDRDSKSITVIIRTDGTRGRLPSLLRTLQQLEGKDFLSIVVAHVGPLPSSLHDYYENLTSGHRARVVAQRTDETIPALLNRAAEAKDTDLLLFLDDRLEPVEGWLDELIVSVDQPGVAIAGGEITDPGDRHLQGMLVLRRDGQILPLYAGTTMCESVCFGNSNWYRNCSAVSGACLMIRRAAFVQAGGFPSDYQHAGYDVELCCRVTAQGQRIFYNPFAKFITSPAEGRFVPLGAADQQRLRTVIQSLIPNGDPYFHVNLAEDSPKPLLRAPGEESAVSHGEPSLLHEAGRADGDNDIPLVRPDASMREARNLTTMFDFSPAQREASLHLQAVNAGPSEIRSVNWFIPVFTNAAYGGIHTILRLANHLRLHHNVVNRFYYLGEHPVEAIRASIVRCFPGLADQLVCPLASDAELDRLEYADACVATFWSTAYSVLKFQRTRRKFYLLQDYEPLFYPAGATSAQVEATYRFGFYGVANTRSLQEIYQRDYGGIACHFTPAVETSVFVSEPRPASPPWRLFFYGRPNTPRNGFELGTEALRRLKQRLGQRVQIMAAGGYWRPEDFGLEGVLENLGVLSIQQTAELYRSCHLGLVLMFTRHPSYLPLELMASGCLVVTNRNAATAWLLRDRDNCLLTEPSVESIAATLEQGLGDATLRERIVHNARAEIDAKYSDWRSELEKVYAFMCDPSSVVEPGGDVVVAPSLSSVAA